MNNNNNYSQQQNIFKSPIDYPIQLSQNLNCCYYIIPNRAPYLSIPFYNSYQIYPTAYLQNPQASLMNNNNKTENQTNYNYNYICNNINPCFSFSNNSNSRIFPSVNNLMNFGPTTPAPSIQDTFFLNRKRSNALSYEKEKENEINSLNMKNDENQTSLQTIEVENSEKMKNYENKETNESINQNIIKDEQFLEKTEQICEKNEKNEKDVIDGSSQEQDQQNKEIKIEETKKKKKRKRNYAELLQDSFLEHIGEPKKKVSESVKQLVNINIETIKKKRKNDSKNKKKQKSQNELNESNDKISKSQSSLKDKKKVKIKPLRNQKKKPQHKITLKNNKDILADLEKNKTGEKSVSNPKLTKVIYHGDNYEKTKSTIDFMKYNFDFSIEEQYKTKKLITDYDHQHIDLNKINETFYDNYNTNNHNLENTEQKWSRKKFEGDNKELKKAISLIRDTFQGRKTDTNEEKCLGILKNNNYNIDELLKSKCDK